MQRNQKVSVHATNVKHFDKLQIQSFKSAQMARESDRDASFDDQAPTRQARKLMRHSTYQDKSKDQLKAQNQAAIAIPMPKLSHQKSNPLRPSTKQEEATSLLDSVANAVARRT